MPPCQFNPSNIYTVWQIMNRLWANIPQGRVKFKVGYLVRKTKEKVVCQGYEQIFSTEIFRVANDTQRVPQPVYELKDMQDRPIEGQVYN